MPYHNGFSASILIDGREANEYQLQYYGDEQTARTVSCYIAAELGQEFSIFWANEDYTDCMASRGTVTFDGNGDYAAREVIYRDDMLKMRSSREPASVTLHGDVLEDGKRFRPFTFSRLARTDDDDLVESGAADIGVIQLSIEGGWAEQDDSDTEPAPSPSEDASDDDDTIDVADEDPGPAEEPLPALLFHEKLKKSHSQQVSLAPARKIPKEQRIASSREDLFSSATPHPIVIFRFLYRPLELLRAQGIAPPAHGQKQRKRDAAELERVRKQAQAQAKRHRGKHAQPAQVETQTQAARPIVPVHSPNSSAQDEHDDDVARATTPPAPQHSSASPRSTTPSARAASYSGAQGPTLVKMEVDSEATSQAQAQSRSDANNAASARISRMKELEAQRAKLDDEIAELKRDLPEDSDIGAQKKKRKIKSEGPSRSVFAHGEVIDLT